MGQKEVEAHMAAEHARSRLETIVRLQNPDDLEAQWHDILQRQLPLDKEKVELANNLRKGNVEACLFVGQVLNAVAIHKCLDAEDELNADLDLVKTGITLLLSLIAGEQERWNKKNED